MIYEYPEEFVVPVVYVKDLKEESMNRDFEIKYLQVEELVVPYEKSQEDEILQIDKYQNESISNKGMGFLDLDADLLKKSYYEEDIPSNNVAENLMEYDDSRSIFNEIDNDYIDSEILRI